MRILCKLKINLALWFYFLNGCVNITKKADFNGPDYVLFWKIVVNCLNVIINFRDIEIKYWSLWINIFLKFRFILNATNKQKRIKGERFAVAALIKMVEKLHMYENDLIKLQSKWQKR